ncbi:MAG TPA: cysteine desulfurase [Planctomycetota bacterium]|nr:cysteine desulfurase [Planctomycetota bacterium]
MASFDVRTLRKDFPILKSEVHGKPLIYLDNAATTQKPMSVIDCLVTYYSRQNANIHRGVHHLSEVATKAYESARVKIQRFLNAADLKEIIFTRGATESINLVAQSFVRPGLQPGDEVVITHLEHHSNIVPWQMLRDEKGLVLKVAPIDDHGDVILEELEKLITPRTKLVSVTHVSNALGTINPVKKIMAMARAKGAKVLLDGAQAVPHLAVDVRDLDCDFYAFSGHKIYGPTGIGVLYGKQALLESMPPYQGGGDMILSVTFEKTKYNHLPYKFEAGTPHIEGVIGLGAAIDYVTKIGLDAIAAHEHEVLEHGTRVLQSIPGLRLIGTAREKTGVLSFELEGVHPHDIGTILDQQGIAIRTGHHCAQPVMDRFGVPATARASLALYNTKEEMDALADGLKKVAEVFRS